MKLAGYVARMGENINSSNVFIVKSEWDRKDDPGVNVGDMILHGCYRNTVDWCELGRYSGRAVFVRSNAGIVGSNPIQGMDVCLRLFCLCCPV
jgi:hypothetical protein